MENFKIKNKIFFEAGGKREADGDDKLTFFFMGPYTYKMYKVLHATTLLQLYTVHNLLCMSL
jgi:hypothetical protein